MPTKTLPYRDTGYFSSLMCDYLDRKESLAPFYNRFPTLESFKGQLEEKGKHFTRESRKLLADRLQAQYEGIETSEATQQNLDALRGENTFTVTTGHQLNLFTGPLYFLYKIFSVINLTEKLASEYPDSHFVPVFWMASEDHDFEEINYFNLFGKKMQWTPSWLSDSKDANSHGAVGALSTEGLEIMAELLKLTFGSSENGDKLATLFQEAYSGHDTLTEATRYLGNSLFSEYGLVIVDGDDAGLKKAFLPHAHKELREEQGYHKVTATTEALTGLGYKAQVTPREINLFYMDKGVRERIVRKDDTIYINNTDLSFGLEEFTQLMEEHPERISPNALLRPLYQETILPNLCYIGGGGEMAYWFQLKHYFESVAVPFPILLLRNSVLLVPGKLTKKLDRLEVDIASLFMKQEALRTAHTHKLSEIKIDLSPQREYLKEQFRNLYDVAEKTDASFLGAVGAQEKKQLNGLDRLEKRLLKAQKRKLSDQLERLTQIQDLLFPGASLQERKANFSEFYLEYGDTLFSALKENLDPLALEFTVLEL